MDTASPGIYSKKETVPIYGWLQLKLHNMDLVTRPQTEGYSRK